jgi:cob(I)alamin adenosyltransferase
MKIYTKTGDQGTTMLFGGQRVSKDTLRIEAYGTVDELNALLGIARTTSSDQQDQHIDTLLHRIQQELFVLGGDMASPQDTPKIERIHMDYVERLEQEIDSFETELLPLRQFILPGGSAMAAQLHLARTVCRRAERHTVRLAADDPVNPVVLSYLNRLSDWLFDLARVANARAGVPDTPWRSTTPES